MIKLGKRRRPAAPEIMLNPMIDMIFLLLVFFILGTMYMSELKTIPIKLPVAATAESHVKPKFSITVNKNGQLWLDDQPSPLESIIAFAKAQRAIDPKFTIVIRGESDASYQQVIAVIDKLKAAGISRVGLSTATEERR